MQVPPLSSCEQAGVLTAVLLSRNTQEESGDPGRSAYTLSEVRAGANKRQQCSCTTSCQRRETAASTAVDAILKRSPLGVWMSPAHSSPALESSQAPPSDCEGVPRWRGPPRDVCRKGNEPGGEGNRGRSEAASCFRLVRAGRTEEGARSFSPFLLLQQRQPSGPVWKEELEQLDP
ncbi:hypothetical protein MRX96_027246 [Rhipicephalus microplus]